MKEYFAFVLGSGFSGALLGWILASQGRDTLIIDRAKHPRFAVGESSTPSADFLLAYISHRWSLPELEPLSCFGTWQATYPEVLCGKKRGFSYFEHRPNEPFSDDADHSSSLMVAASVNDAWSDTHWYRADVDHFFARQAQQAGARLLEHTQMVSAQWDPSERRWRIEIAIHPPAEHQSIESEKANASPREPQRQTVFAKWLIDASGFGGGTEKWLDHVVDDDWMRTRSGTIFGHFDDVQSFSRMLPDHEEQIQRYFDADDAAQHHVVEDGWYWMLRFLGNRTSVGIVVAEGLRSIPPDLSKAWTDKLQCYPSVEAQMAPSRLVGPIGNNGPRLSAVARMSRCRSHAIGPGWCLLPVTYGFVDPLHSTGIAHALSGVARVADALLDTSSKGAEKLARYGSDVRSEVRWIDTLVSGSYRGLPHFPRFTAFASYYFAASIGFEKQLATDPEHWPHGFLSAKDIALTDEAERVWNMANQCDAVSHRDYTDAIRKSIEPWNQVGLLAPELRNRLNHTAPPKRVAWMQQLQYTGS